MMRLLKTATLLLVGTPVLAQEAPADQETFQAAIVSTRDAYNGAKNDLAKGGQRSKREKEICTAVVGEKITDWVGEIYSLSSNSEGRGILSVELDGDIWLSTWNNGFSDIGDNTLISPDSELFASLSEMAEGQTVIFSGRFIKDEADDDCFKEQSMTMGGYMSQPEYVIVFEAVNAAP